ncbi:MAG: SDR family oxidoreductase [Planctomycetia bacterium]|nr:SDR family oxidoreductase [Planctomycetia bacterium]
MDLALRDHVAVIVGGASGIGLASAKLFAAEGAKVAVWDRVPAEGFFSLVVDVVDEAAVNAAMARTLAEFGRVDHLVHAAAIGSGKFGFPFTNMTPADWPRVLQVNVMGMTNVAHAVAPHLRERRAGTMVFLASVAGQIGSQTDPPYSASKAANINFAQCLAKDLAPYGVRVNTICPGMVKTPLNRSVWQAWHDAAKPEERLSYEEWSAKKIQAVVPLGQWQLPEDIADMVVFLSSARAAHVTGQTINVDGGFVMHW